MLSSLPLSHLIRYRRNITPVLAALPFLRPSLLKLTPPSPSQRRPGSTCSPSPRPTIERLTSRWSGRLPQFAVRGRDITVLREPEEFWRELKALIQRARRRITISSLYVGDGESELIDTLRTALSTHPDLKVTFLLDKNRCTRKPWPQPSTAALLYPLARDFSPERVQVWFYQSPSFVARLFPNRLKEGFGTWHSKIYAGDEGVIITGANLSHDYFTTRQDRYFLFRNASSLTTYLSSLVDLYTQFSYRLLPTNTPAALPPLLLGSSSPSKAPSSTPSPAPFSLVWSSSSPSSPKTFHAAANKALTTFQSHWVQKTLPPLSSPSSSSSLELDTVIWPVIQVGYLDVREEEQAMSDIWEEVDLLAKEGGSDAGMPLVDMTSGYFALSEGYKTAVLESKADVRIVAASPKANGFYGSKGISGLIPDGYTMLERDFERETRRRGRAQVDGKGGVEVSEWERKGWTYHAKGIWLSPPSPTSTSAIPSPANPSSPILTLLGSSNLSSRSCNLDAETSFFIATTSPFLRTELAVEVERIRAFAKRVGEETWASKERKVGWRVRRIVSPVPRGLGFGKQL